MEIDIVTMFATFVGFVTSVVAITEFVNKLFKVENSKLKLIISWILSIGLACIGFVYQIGFFADCGTIDMWQGWIKTILVGFGCGLCANKMYNRDEIWSILEIIFSFLNKK